MRTRPDAKPHHSGAASIGEASDSVESGGELALVGHRFGHGTGDLRQTRIGCRADERERDMHDLRRYASQTRYVGKEGGRGACDVLGKRDRHEETHGCRG